MFRSSWHFLFLLIGEALCLGIKPYELKILSYSVWPENSVWDISKARLTGRDRLLNGTVTLREDMDNGHYIFSFESFSDPVGDGNFKLLPFQIPRTPMCDAYKKYRPLFAKHAEYGKQTDFPVHQDICPIPKGTYYLKNIELSAENWPAILPRGFLRGNGSFYRNNEHLGTYSVTVLVKDINSQ
nr:uncharacterized protein LOC108071401 [Drosophila kikkawai]